MERPNGGPATCPRTEDGECAGSQVAWPPVGHHGRWASVAHALFYGTLLIAVAMSRATSSAPSLSPTELALAALLAAWYSWWILRRGHELAQSPAYGLRYFAVVGILWTALLWQEPAYELLSFSIFTQLLGYLRWRTALVAAVLGVVLSHLPRAIQNRGLGLEHLAFAVVSLSALVLIVVSLRSVTDQSIRRQRLIEELEAARAELANAARHAGILEERHRLAGEVHDTIAQALASVVMLLEAAQSAGSDSARLERHLDQALRTAREGLAEVRRVVWALRPESLESGSIADALARTAVRLAAQTGIAARALVTGTPRPLPAELEVTLLRVAQEGLANVGRHARAREALVTLSYLHDVVTLDVWDDGVGFDPAALPAEPLCHGGLGLLGMRERVQALQGSLSVESAPGQGTTLVVELPADPHPFETGHTEERQP